MAVRALALLVGACLLGAQAATTPAPAQAPTPTPQVPKVNAEDLRRELQAVVPTAYSINLQVLHESPSLNPFERKDWIYNLTGTVNITLTCRSATDRLHLASSTATVHIREATLSSATLKEHPMTVSHYPSSLPFITLNLPKNLSADHSYHLRINFTRLVDTWNMTKYSSRPVPNYAAILIEPGYVSDFIPVLNSTESSGKVNVELNVTHKTNYTCVSSARPLRHVALDNPAVLPPGHWTLTVFEKTHLIDMKHFGAFVSSDFDLANETKTLRVDSSGGELQPEGSWKDVRARVWARPTFKRAVVYTTQLVPEAICYIQCYLGVPFPTNGIELIANPIIQGNPIVGSSIVFFRESDMLPDGQLEGLLVVLSRVIAEQYIGVMVTPLPDTRPVNQAIVNYVASEMVRTMRPRELSKERASVTKGSRSKEQKSGPQPENGSPKLEKSMAADTNNSHPDSNATICKCDQYEGDKSDVLVNALYSLYYELGSQFPLSNLDLADQRPALQATKTELVLRMLSITLGERTFKAALKTLLDEKKESYYTADDFWKILSDQAYTAQSLEKSLNVKSIVDSWISRDRFPLLTVHRTPDNSANLTQTVFRRRAYDPEERSGQDKENGLVWTIPIVTLTEGEKFARADHPPRLWMTEQTIMLENASHGDSFLVVNPEETAPCIVNYDKRNWELVSNALNDRREPVLPPRTRAKLLHDAVMLAHAGELEFGDALPLLRSLEREISPAVWQPVGNVLDHLRRDVEGTRLEGKFKAFLEAMLRAALSTVDALVVKLHALQVSSGVTCSCEQRQLNETRTLILHQLSRANMEPCITEAREAYKAWAASEDRDRGIPMSESLRCCLFQWGTDEEYEFGIQRLKSFSPESLRMERLLLLREIAGCPRQPERRVRIMKEVLLDDKGQFSDEEQRSVMLYSSGRGNDLFKFFVDNWDYFRNKWDESKFYMWETLVSRACADIKSKADIETMKQWIDKPGRPLATARRIVQDSIKKAEINVAWAEKAFPSMEAWLDKYQINHRKE